MKKLFSYLINQQILLVINRLLLFINMAVSIYLSSSYLTVEQISIVLSILSLIGIFFIFDFGIVNTAQKKLLFIKKNLIKKTASSLYILSIINSTLITILFTIILQVIDLNSIFKFKESMNLLETKKGILLFILGFAFQLNNLFYEKITIITNNYRKFLFLSTFSILISLCLIFIFLRNDSSISNIIFFNFVIHNIMIFLTFQILFFNLFDFRKITVNLVKKCFFDINQNLFKYFIISLSIIFCFGIDPYLISYYYGIESTSGYTILQRIFQILIVPILILNTPISKFYSIFEKKNKQINKNLIASILAITLFLHIIFYSILKLYGDHFVSVWTQNMIIIPSLMYFAYTLRSLSESYMINITNYFNGIDKIKLQYYFSLIMVFLAIPLKIFFIRKFGIEYMIIYFYIAYISLFLILLLLTYEE